MNQNFYLVLLGVVACVAGFALGQVERAVGDDYGEGNLESRLSAMNSSGVPGEVVAESEKITLITDGEALRELWESYGNDARGQIGRQLVVERWAEIDPLGAYEFFEGN